ncbi:hypothetical protein ACFYNO_31780 [Kitasatospora sp. NPDC006697]|uniref:hypothetical protein n=1 Tax=Kitasatospora sp. NPDC006697 TaxID=3364020 RepID=UPI0036A13995
MIGLVLAVGLPLLDRSVKDNAVVAAGDRLELGDGLTIAPPEGWRLTKGVTVDMPTLVPAQPKSTSLLTDGPVKAVLQVGPFRGDSVRLLEQMNRNAVRSTTKAGFTARGERTAVVSTDGLDGVQERYTADSGEGTLTAFALPGDRGLVVAVTAPDGGQLSARNEQVQRMLSSLALTGTGDRS